MTLFHIIYGQEQYSHKIQPQNCRLEKDKMLGYQYRATAGKWTFAQRIQTKCSFSTLDRFNNTLELRQGTVNLVDLSRWPTGYPMLPADALHCGRANCTVKIYLRTVCLRHYLLSFFSLGKRAAATTWGKEKHFCLLHILVAQYIF